MNPNIDQLIKCDFCECKFISYIKNNIKRLYCLCINSIRFTINAENECQNLLFRTKIDKIIYIIDIYYDLNKSILTRGFIDINLNRAFKFDFRDQKRSVKLISDKISKLMVFT